MNPVAPATAEAVSPLHRRLEAEQIRLLHTNLPLGLAAGIFNAGVLVFVQRDVIAHGVLVAWFALVALITLARLVLYFGYRRANPPVERARVWGLWYAAGVVLSGATWGAAGVFLFSDDLAHQTFVVFLLAGMTAGAVVTFYAHMWVAYLFIVPNLLPLIVRLLNDPHEIGVGMGLMATLFLVLMLATARRMHLVTLTSLRLRFENSDLVAGLAHEKRETEILNLELKREIGERIRVEEGLRESEGRIRAIVDNVLDGIVTVDDDGRLESANPAAEKIFGYGRGELVGRPFRELLPPAERDEHEALLRDQAGRRDGRPGGFGFEATGLRRDGGSFPMELGVSRTALGSRRLLVVIVRDITERRQVERMKNRFVAAVSHELRTPLTSLMGSIGLLAEDAAGELSERGQSLLGIARGNVERLARLVGDILDFEEIQSGRVWLNLRTLDLVALVEQAVERHRAEAASRGIALVFAPALRVAGVRADRERLLHVMTHLLANAVKFSPPQSAVTVGLAPHEDAVRVTVTDQGPGIPAEFHARVFDAFSQAETAGAAQAGGTGLGLSIARAIVELHGGRIGFESTPGHGARFYFDLPRAPDSAPAG